MAGALPPTAASAPSRPQQPGTLTLPLSDFHLPDFPPRAAGLLALTLTSAIPPEDYAARLAEPWSVGALPRGIQSLTLEYFTRGYPAGFLGRLADALPDLKSLVLYSQTVSGTSKESEADAAAFFAKASGVRALHLLDCYAAPGFIDGVAGGIRGRERGVMFLEVSFTFSLAEGIGFLGRIPGGEIPGLVGRGLISCSFNVTPAEGEDSAEGGIMALESSRAGSLVEAFTAEATSPLGLKALNCTLYTLSTAQVGQLCATLKSLMILNVTVETQATEDCKRAILEAVSPCTELEQLEIVANPALSPTENMLETVFPTQDEMHRLSEKLPKLSKFAGNVLRAKGRGEVHWEKVGGLWRGGVRAAVG